MNLAFCAFTDRGEALARRLAGKIGGHVARCGPGRSLRDWTAEAFPTCDGLVFIGAAGIAVRAVAPYLAGKGTDPAVVVVDENGRYAIPLLSGHLGGANDLARRLAALCGAAPVITTATDGRQLFAADNWARIQGCAVPEPERIKAVSAKLLAGEEITVCSPWPICGEPPPGVALTEGPADVTVTLSDRPENTLRLVPKIIILGIGCRRGATKGQIAALVEEGLAHCRLALQGVCRVCTIDQKGEEPGLVDFCKERRLPLITFSAKALSQVEGEFSASAFVREVIGVDNVCERSAVLGGGETLLLRKTKGDGVTLAIARAPFALDWRWQDEG